MTANEWSRSRYWHIHFLQSRHERIKIDWNRPDASGEGRELPPAIRHYLADLAARQAQCGAWLIKQTAKKYAHDPAYVQTLRLTMREQQHHRDLLTRLIRTDSPSVDEHQRTNLLIESGRWLGPRYTMSAILLSDLVDAVFLSQIRAQVHGDPTDGVLRTILSEKRAHVAFHRERLTMAFADFNTIRRNLRRHRLRTMFAVKLARTVALQHRAIGAMSIGKVQFVARCWKEFELLLNRMVPYRREALLRALRNQEQNPYDEAAGLNEH